MLKISSVDSIITMPSTKIAQHNMYMIILDKYQINKLPIWIQNNDMQGKLVPTNIIINLINDFENIQYLKEESICWSRYFRGCGKLGKNVNQ